MKNQKRKKAFTIVELVIVIAVIAILAAVLIPTFSNVIRQANLSKDQQMVRNMNTDIAIESVNNMPTTAGDAVTLLYGVGYNAGKFDAYTSDCHYAYCISNNTFYLLDGTDIIFPNTDVSKNELWGFYSNDKADYIEGITHYVALESITDKTQFDAFCSAENFEIDLNSNVFSVNPEKAVKISNGYNIVSSDKVTGGTSMTEATSVSGGSEYSENVIKAGGVTLNSSNVTKFEKCVFTSKFQVSSSSSSDVVKFVDCTFTGLSDGWSLTVGECQYEISGCTFINCDRGVNVDMVKGGIIEGCTFKLNQLIKGKNNAIQLCYSGAYSTDSNVFTSLGEGETMITIRNNNFAQCNAAVIIHENTYVKCTDSTPPTGLNHSGWYANNNQLFTTYKDKLIVGPISNYTRFATFFDNDYSGVTSDMRVILDLDTYATSGEHVLIGAGYLTSDGSWSNTAPQVLKTAIENALTYLNNQAK